MTTVEKPDATEASGAKILSRRWTSGQVPGSRVRNADVMAGRVVR